VPEPLAAKVTVTEDPTFERVTFTVEFGAKFAITWLSVEADAVKEYVTGREITAPFALELNPMILSSEAFFA